MTTDSPLPRAWLGYAPPQKGRVTVRICAWCPDKDQAEARARAKDCIVTHSICVPCYQAAIAREIGD